MLGTTNIKFCFEFKYRNYYGLVREISLREHKVVCGLGLISPLNAELNPICHLLALLGAHHIIHVSSVRVRAWRVF